MTTADVSHAYSQRADEYVAAVGHIEAVHPADLELVREWAAGLEGELIDAGCGPGHWTSFLQDHGASVEGVDLVPTFISQAKARYPGVPFRVGTLDDLKAPDASLGGILAWYSIIHMTPAEVAAALREFARCVWPGGGLLLGFFEGLQLESFPHAVVPAYYWPIEELSRRLSAAGFETVETHSRVGPGHRPHGAIAARRFDHSQKDENAHAS
ncbi:SAM-dependent methyltransferase [Arthrobacter pigmenti]|uniref:SAM-dependent methyltransferase n=1 Tax=Arthrobacter pigmenti TaxID=271432 RepID=A0A846RWN1_9MICC|nr:SAM-dependent methyltransferase [Arthrobacter pigmenti]